MKVVLTAPPFYVPGVDGRYHVDPQMPPLALYSLASILRRGGFDACVVDPYDLDPILRGEVAPEARFQDAQVVAISANTSGWAHARYLAARLKEELEPAPLIVAGGIHPTLFDDHVLRTSKVDVVVRGEGDHAALELFRALDRARPLDEVAGISWRAGARVSRTPERPPLRQEELARLPMPAYEDVPAGVYEVCPVESSRGCRFNCNFCSIPYRKHWRSFGSESVLARTEHALRHLHRFKQPYVFFADDCLTTDSGFVRELFAGLEGLQGGVSYGIEARVTDLLRADTLDHVARVPLHFVQLGIEAGYDVGLRRIGKGLKTRLVRDCASRLAALRFGDSVKYSFIIGFPWEGREEWTATLNFGFEIGVAFGGVLQFNWVIPYAGSRLYEELAESGGISTADFDTLDWFWKRFFSTHPRVRPEDVEWARQTTSTMKLFHPRLRMEGNVAYLTAAPLLAA